MRPIVKLIYDRHVAALHGVTAGSTWIDHAAASLSLWLALEELDAHHVGINPTANELYARWRKMEEDLLTFLDDAGADGNYAGDPVAAVRRIVDARDANIVKVAECVDAQAAIIEDLRQQLRQAVAPTVHVNGSSPAPTVPAEIEPLDNHVAISPAAQATWSRLLASAPVMSGQPPAAPPADAPTPAAQLPATRVNWGGLPADLQAQIQRLEDGSATWRNLLNTDRRAIALYAIPRVGSSPAMTLSEWGTARPAWMPTGSALAQFFGLRWTELVAQAHKFAAE